MKQIEQKEIIIEKDKSETIDTNRIIEDIKRERSLTIKKNILTFTLGNLLVISNFKLFNFGFPYIKDSKKKYNVTQTITNNNDEVKKIERYVFYNELRDYERENDLIYIKDIYNNDYSRNVSVYEINKVDNYDDLDENYQHYITNSKLIDNYEEISSIIDKRYLKDKEIIVEHYEINKKKYKKEYESEKKNLICSIVYSFVLGSSIIILSLSNLRTDLNTNREIKRLKRKKEGI